MPDATPYARCVKCQGGLDKSSVLYFQRTPPGNDPNREGEKPSLSEPPPWADADTRRASLGGLSRPHVLSFYRSEHASACHREIISADERYARIPALYAMLEELIHWHNHMGRSIALVYACACPHCGDRDPVGAIDLILAEPDLIRALAEADDRPWLEYDADGRLIGTPLTQAERLAQHVRDAANGVACPACGKLDGDPKRFCRSCGHDRGRAYVPPVPVMPPPAPPVVARRERPPLMSCRACGTALTPRAVFEVEYYHRNTGVREDDDVLRPPPVDPWKGQNWVRPGGAPREAAEAALAADPAWQQRSAEERDLEARRRAASHYLSTIPRPRNPWAGHIVRGLIRPCRACGEADPLGTAGPPSPVT